MPTLLRTPSFRPQRLNTCCESGKPRSPDLRRPKRKRPGGPSPWSVTSTTSSSALRCTPTCTSSAEGAAVRPSGAVGAGWMLDAGLGGGPNWALRLVVCRASG
ncbi:hypothetical protein GCM10017566_36300 [Amycolatopsis bartoniae]|uniref:Uncharacterized protein n=1 Tax=Amycolatopsis bartoniae TaxID=941986 RepID=A0A8H9IZ03_9PSEU|nr:hypothetical protein GCM10017566_36300 [Amycolatopsis bartoniae]